MTLVYGTSERLSNKIVWLGLGFVMEDTVVADIERGELVRVLADWCPPFGGYYLYYPSRRQPSFKLIVDALRARLPAGRSPRR